MEFDTFCGCGNHETRPAPNGIHLTETPQFSLWIDFRQRGRRGESGLTICPTKGLDNRLPMDRSPIVLLPPGRRLRLSDADIFIPPILWGGHAPLPELAPSRPPQEIEDRKGEARRIVKRLMAIIEEHRVSAQRIGVTLDADALDMVIQALEAEIRMDDPLAVLKSSGDELLSYVTSALYEELLAEPSNILFTTHVAKDVVRYEAMEPAFWKQCIAVLRQELIP
jgi:hypothetical protein